jgi:hypothetical protein
VTWRRHPRTLRAVARAGTRGRALAKLLLVAFLLVLVWLGLPSRNVSFALGRTTDEVTILDARLAGRDLKGADTKHPLVLRSDANTPFSMKLRNNTDQPVHVEFARFEGRSLAIAFLHYDLGIKTVVPAKHTTTINTNVNFYSLDRAATGYLQAALRVYNQDTHAIGQEKFVVDVKGKPVSQVGLVTIELALLAVACLVEIIVRAFRNSLPGNRFVRGLVFGFTGAVIAVAIVLATAALRIALMPAHTWVPLLVFATVIGFALGYLSPGPTSGRAEEDRAMLDLVAAEAVARASGQHTGANAPEGDVAYSSGDHSAVSLVSPPSRDDLAPPAHHDSGRHDSGRQQPAGDSPATDA